MSAFTAAIFRFAFRLIKHDFLPNGNLRSFPENDFLSVSVFHSLELFGRNDFVIVSHDEFATFHVKQVHCFVFFYLCSLSYAAQFHMHKNMVIQLIGYYELFGTD